MSEIKVKTYSPKFSVDIHTERSGILSFTNDVVRAEIFTTKRTLADNKWRVVLVPRGISDKDEVTIYDAIQPMDYCEIKIHRLDDKNPSPRVVMRGFVSTISKDIEISDGKPHRSIVISGEDYGKIIRMSYIHYAAGLDPLQRIAAGGTRVPLFAGYGIDLVTVATPPSKAVQESFDILVTPNFVNVKNLLDNRGGDKTIDNSVHNDKFGNFLTDIDHDGVDGTRIRLNLQISDSTIGAKEQSVVDFFKVLSGAPWNEMFVDNAPENSYLVFRPFPYRDRDGNYVGATHFKQTGDNQSFESELNSQTGYQPSSDRQDTENPIDIDFADIISVQLSRSDEEVYNYFYTDATSSPIGEKFEQLARSRFLSNDGFNPHYTVGPITFSLADGSNVTTVVSPKIEYSRMELFGFRKHWCSSVWLSVNPSTEDIAKIYKQQETNAGRSIAEDLTPGDVSMVATSDILNRILFDAFEHNSVLENGSLAIKGNELIRPGMYVRFSTERYKSVPAMYYVTDVTHVVVPYESFVTQLTVHRGEAYLTKREKTVVSSNQNQDIFPDEEF